MTLTSSVNMKEENGSANSGSDDGSSENSDDNSDEEESEEDEDATAESDKKTSMSQEKELPAEVCAVCINTRTAAAAGDFMRCDRYV